MTSTFLIGPIKEGLRKDVKPFATPEDSFQDLTNAVQFRGRVIKRQGVKKLGRLPNGTAVTGLRTKDGFNLGIQQLIAFDRTSANLWNGTSFVPLPSVMTTTWNGADWNLFYTVNYANAFWATNNIPGLNGVNIQSISNANPAVVTTTTAHNFTSGQSVSIINVTGYGPTASTTPSINAQNFVITVITPTTFSIVLDGTLYGAYGSGGIALNPYVQTTGQDGIRYYGILSNGTGWANYNPPVDENNALAGALLIFPYRGYLVFLNTWEGNEEDVFNYYNRARYTQIGTPYYSEPVPVDPNPFGFEPEAARDDLFGRGGATDAPTNESIVSAGFIRDILIVKFERSTWRLRFTNVADNPFVWERVNVELGSDCTFGTVIFDKGMMDISQRGINISDANDCIRFDEKIPDQVFNIRQAENGFERVYGIRTFESKRIYWAFKSSNAPYPTYNNQVLVYNYENQSWAIFDDSFTCFGYYYKTGTGLTWGDLPNPWSSYTNISWNSGISEAGFENIVAGNQQGYVLILEQTAGYNDPSLAISAMAGTTVTSNNHNIPDLTWITLSGVTGTTSSDGVSLNGRNFQISNPTLNVNTFSLYEYAPINGGTAVGTAYTYDVDYDTILKGSIQVNVGALVFTDPNSTGFLIEASGLGSGIFDYKTGKLNLLFSPAIASTTVYIRVVSLDPDQDLVPVTFTGAYTGGGEIAIRSNINITTKIFNFFKNNQRARLNYIDFYTNSTTNGQFICNIYGDSSDDPINTPFPISPQSNVVLTYPNSRQIGLGEETLYRMYAHCDAQTLQFELTMSDQQMAVNSICQSDLQLLAMMVNMRQGGRLI